MGHTKPTHGRPQVARPQRPVPATSKPRGEHQLSDATWTRLCQAIRAMQLRESTQHA